MVAQPVGIETVYRNHRFRSRAEARWAAFFDRLGWSWTYEPIDLENYIPDFFLNFHKPLLVEVKGGAIDEEALRTEPRKVTKTSWNGEVLMVGATPLTIDDTGDWLSGMSTRLGLLGERVDDEYDFGTAILFRCLCCGRISIRSESGSWACRVRGCHSGNAYVGSLYDFATSEAWADASTLTRWQPKNDHCDDT